MKKNWFSIISFIFAIGVCIATFITFYIDEEMFILLCSWFSMCTFILLLAILGLASWKGKE